MSNVVASQHGGLDPKDLEEEEELFPPIHRETYLTSVVVVDNIPVIPKEKEEKLMSVLNRIFTSFGKVNNIYMPYENDGSKSRGFAFIEFVHHGEARCAQEKLNNYKLDKSHVFKTNLFEDFEVLDKLPSEYKSSVENEVYQPMEDLYEWLKEPYGSDQYVLRYGELAELWWYGKTDEGQPPGHIKSIPCPRDNPVQWSPKGTYLVAFHQLGVILWGGPSWNKLRKMPHNGVQEVHFSPNENYLVTFSPQYIDTDLRNKEKKDRGDPQALLIWDVKSGQPIRGFMYNGIFPAFRWSYDDKYFSRISKGRISVYETPKMVLLESNKHASIKLEASVKDHAWSPTDNMLCAYLPEQQQINTPARVILMEIPSLRIIGEKALFNVVSCVILWQEKGDYLAVSVDRAKTKKKTFTSFEFFRIREKNIPVEDMKLDDTVLAFAWEPKGNRFAIIHASESTENRFRSVSFYTMVGSNVNKIVTLTNRSVSHLLWSPRGRFIVLFSNSGTFEFYDVDTQETMSKDKQHPMATNVAWDPTGRYLTTYVSAWKSKTEHGYKIWSFRGLELQTIYKEGFAQFVWRPRPPTLLSPQQLKQLEDPSFFKTYSRKYKAEDKVKQDESKKILKEEREKMKCEWRKLMGKKRKEYEEDKPWRESQGIVEQDWYLVEEMVEEVVEVKEEVVKE